MAKQLDTSLVLSEGFATIGGVKFRCTRTFSHCALNSIPFCKVTVAPKADGGSFETYAALYVRLNKVAKIGEDAKVTYKFEGSFQNSPSSEADKDPGEITVFEGKVAGWGPVYIQGFLQITVWIVHPLVQLDWSSSIVDEIHSVSMGDPAFPTRPSTDDDTPMVPYMMEPYTEDDVSDLWENVIKKELIRTAGFQRFGNPNDAALALLNDKDKDISSDEAPLNLLVASRRRAIIDIRKTLQMAGDGHTLWDRLIELASRFQFAISPRLNGKFSVIPYYPLLKKDPSITFKQEEFTGANDFISYMGRVLDGVELFEGSESYAFPFDITSRKGKKDEARAVYKDEQRAMRLFDPPSWLQVGPDLSYRTNQTIGLDGLLSAGGYTVTASDDSASGITPNQEYNDGGEDTNKYARCMRDNTLFQQRTAYLKGLLRYDMAPGSLVRVEAPGSDKEETKEETVLYGTVHTVISGIDSAAQDSSVWVMLTNVHSQDEHDQLKEESHPLYGDGWLRAPLIDIEGHVPKFEKG